MAQRPGAAANPAAPMTAQRVLIAGCGDLGTRVARLHLARGDQVFAVRRGAVDIAGVVALRADLAAPGPLPVPAGLNRVYYTAAPGPVLAGYEAVYGTGVARMLTALEDPAGVRVVLTTSTRVYAQTDGDWVDETSPVNRTDPRCAAMLGAEQRLATAGVRAISVRLAGLYGTGPGRLAARLRAGSAHASARWTARIHRQDAARALVHLADLPEPAARYLACDDCPASEVDVLTWLAGELGLPAPLPVPIPTGLAHRRCSNARLRASGFRFEYPDFRTGYAAVLAGTA